MKNWLLIMAIYYISVSGSALNNGLSESLPWDLATLNAASLSPGDQILLKRGDVFNGSLVIDDSGEVGNYIYFSAYGTGNNPILSGFTEVNGWIDQDDNIWESDDVVSTLSLCNVVVVDDVNTPAGRLPNMVPLPSDLVNSDGSWVYGSTFPNKTTLINSVLEGLDWTGGTVVIRTNRFMFERGVITDHTGGTLTYIPEHNYYIPSAPAGFFIKDHLDCLINQDEWYYNKATKKISIYSTTEPISVKVTAIENIIDVQGNYIDIRNISIEGANTNGIRIGEFSNIYIRDCEIQYTLNGIYSNSGHLSSAFTIQDNTITDSNNCGINLQAREILVNGYSDSLISGNIITNSGIFAGMGTCLPNDYAGIHANYFEESTIIYNEITNVGHNGIDCIGAEKVTITKNYIDNYCLLLDDGGGIMVNRVSTWRTISYNLVFNGMGSIQGFDYTPDTPKYGYNAASGIYMDSGGNDDNNSVLNNTIYNAKLAGIIWAIAHDSYIRNNLIYDCRIGIYNTSAYVKEDDYAIEVTGNIVFSSLTEIDPNNGLEGCIAFGDDSGVFSPLINMDDNYYCRPKNQDDAIYSDGFGGDDHGTIAEWAAFSGLDASSLPFDSDGDADSTPLFVYNNTQAVVVTKLDYPMIEADGTKHNRSISLDPFTAAVLLRDNNPTQNYLVFQSDDQISVQDNSDRVNVIET